ncbi:MAG TPA: Rdx family protein [Nitrospirota bacterium]|nr:Rdx family protein [Nitrospirota bacterium]
MKRLSILYCGTCNYRPIAAGLSRAIETETGIKPVLIHSQEMGAFEISVNDELIFSKHVSGRFPDFAEIVEIVKKKTEPDERHAMPPGAPEKSSGQ